MSTCLPCRLWNLVCTIWNEARFPSNSKRPIPVERGKDPQEVLVCIRHFSGSWWQASIYLPGWADLAIFFDAPSFWYSFVGGFGASWFGRFLITTICWGVINPKHLFFFQPTKNVSREVFVIQKTPKRSKKKFWVFSRPAWFPLARHSSSLLKWVPTEQTWCSLAIFLEIPLVIWKLDVFFQGTVRPYPTFGKGKSSSILPFQRIC